MKAQGATEYLVIVGVVLMIALVCVALLVWPTGTTKDVRKSQGDILFGIGKIGYEELSNGLISYYKFDDVPGPSVNSISGAGDATFYNGVAGIAGVRGKGAYFDGADDYVLSAVPSSTMRGNFSATGWFKADRFGSTSSISNRLLTSWQSPSSSGWAVGANNGRFSIMTPSQFLGSDLSTGAWYFFAVTYDGNNFTAYLNGVADIVGGSITSSADDYVRIGIFSESQSGANKRAWNGTIDDVHFYNRVLSASEIETMYRNPGYP